MADGWEDATVRARKVEGGYESIFDWDDEELVVNFFSFDDVAESLEEDLGRKLTPEEVEEKARMFASDPMVLDTLPPAPRLDEEEIGEIATNWSRVRTHILGKADLLGKLAVMKKEREKEGNKD